MSRNSSPVMHSADVSKPVLPQCTEVGCVRHLHKHFLPGDHFQAQPPHSSALYLYQMMQAMSLQVMGLDRLGAEVPGMRLWLW